MNVARQGFIDEIKKLDLEVEIDYKNAQADQSNCTLIANLSLLGKNTIFSDFEKALPILKENPIFSSFTIGFAVCMIVILILTLFFKTQIGLGIRATGDNEQMMRAQGGNTDFKKIIALMISSLLCGLAGGLIAQSQGYSDVNMGTGTIAIALASIVIGESFMTFFKMKNKILGAFIIHFVYC